jgi:bifunctional enzyme CysN/CysC
VLVPATARKREHRDRARALAPGAFVEVFVDTSPERCCARDAKGLYAQAATRQGATTLPGAGVGYEAPESPDEVVREDDPEPLRRILARLLT